MSDSEKSESPESLKSSSEDRKKVKEESSKAEIKKTQVNNMADSERKLGIIPTLSPLDFSCARQNLADMWKNWIFQFKIFMRASNMENEENSRKVAIFLHYLGQDALPIFNSFGMDIDQAEYVAVIKKFEEFCSPKKNIAMERHNFFTRKQLHGESIAEFITNLKNLSKSCELGTLQDDIVKDIFICGLYKENHNIRDKLLQEGTITLEKALEIAKVMEHSKSQSKQLEGHTTTVIAKVDRRKPSASGYSSKAKNSTNFESLSLRDKNGITKSALSKPKQQSNHGAGYSKSCSRCGQQHRLKCPAFGAICQRCGKANHFAKMCKSKLHVKYLQTDENAELFLGSLYLNGINIGNNDLWTIKLNINKKSINCLLDTGAQANVLSLKTFKFLNLDEKCIKHTKSKIVSFTGENIKIIGMCSVRCNFNEQTEIPIDFYIIKNKNCIPIIGLKTCRELNLLKKVNGIYETKNHSNEILNKFDDVFTGLGRLPEKVHLKVDPDIKPKIDPPRKVPFKLMNEYKEELDRMERLVMECTLVGKIN